MKITKRQLRKIIKEEKAKLLQENEYFEGSMMDLDDHNELVIQIERIVNLFEKRGYTMEDVVHAISNTLGEFK